MFVTDVRFENEAQWIKMNNGVLVHISREGVGPANHEEHRQYVRMKKYIHFNLHWPTFGDEDIEKADEYVLPALSALLKNMPEVDVKFEEVV